MVISKARQRRRPSAMHLRLRVLAHRLDARQVHMLLRQSGNVSRRATTPALAVPLHPRIHHHRRLAPGALRTTLETSQDHGRKKK
jgi:hypothetical protein